MSSKETEEAGPELKRSKPSEVDLELIPLQDIDDEDVKDMHSFCRSPSLMRYVGESKPWSLSYLLQMRSWAAKDAARSKSRQYYSWAIAVHVPEPEQEKPDPEDAGEVPVRTRKVVGYLGLRPTRDASMEGLQVRIVVSRAHQGKGYAKWALKQAERLFKQNNASGSKCVLWSVINKDNTASQKLFTSCGYTFVGPKTFHGSDTPQNVFCHDITDV